MTKQKFEEGPPFLNYVNVSFTNISLFKSGCVNGLGTIKPEIEVSTENMQPPCLA